MTNVEYMFVSYGLAWGLLVAYVGYVHLKLARLDASNPDDREE